MVPDQGYNRRPRFPEKEKSYGLDIGEHGNQAYPDFMAQKINYSSIVNDIRMDKVATETK
jgi:Amt family ammonium transporter